MSNARPIVCLGELLIDFVPTVNGVSLAEAPAFQKAPGGAPANVAVGAARLGRPAAFIGKVGDEEFGRLLARILADNGVDIRGLRFEPDARTALAFVTLRADGEREFMFYRHPSADMLLRPDEMDVPLIQSAAILHFGSISLIAEPCRSAHLYALEQAEQAGVLLSYDPNLRLPLWPSPQAAKEGIFSVWARAQVIKINTDELAFLTDGRGDMDRLWHDRLRLLLITEGAGGCRYVTPHFAGLVPGIPVATVDTTGAGDAFVAAFLSQLADNPALLEDEAALRMALRFANAAGALTTTRRGAIPALPTRPAIDALLAAAGG